MARSETGVGSSLVHVVDCQAQPPDGTANWRIESPGRCEVAGSLRRDLGDKGRRDGDEGRVG